MARPLQQWDLVGDPSWRPSWLWARPYWPRWTSDEANFAVILAVLGDLIIGESVSACSLHTVAHASSPRFWRYARQVV